MNGLALCAGGGGLELGLKLALGPEYKCLGYCERDSFAAATLMARMEDKALDKASIWDDIESFPCESYRGKVDIISAGFPCQPWSAAGTQKGQEDPRWLWPHIIRIISDIRPSLIFLENVPRIVDPGGLDAVAGDLASLGYMGANRPLSAGALGSPQERERLWILAYTESLRRKSSGEQQKYFEWDRPGEICKELGDANGERLEGSGQCNRPHGSRRRAWPPGSGMEERSEWNKVIAECPQVEPTLRGLADGMAYRVDRTRVAGNGVSPLVAAYAFRTLAARAGLI